MIIPDENTKWLLELLSLCDVSPEEFEHRKKLWKMHKNYRNR